MGSTRIIRKLVYLFEFNVFHDKYEYIIKSNVCYFIEKSIAAIVFKILKKVCRKLSMHSKLED